MTGPFQVIDGFKDQLTFVCPWCAGKFPSRADLDMHWDMDPRCKANARSNNPTTTKYGMAAGIENIPGEATITRIRQKGCEHPENLRENLYADLSGEGPVLGFRCGYCYTELHFEPSAE